MSSALNKSPLSGTEVLPKGIHAQIGIVVSKWNSEITDKLLAGAIQTLTEKGISEDCIKVEFVPGSFEIPLAAQWLIETYGCDSVICLGCVIQGETRHFDFICNSVANGIMDLNLKFGIPVIFGVLTTNNMHQAIDRSGGKYGNKGIEAASTAISMISLKFKCSL
ncbi:MAG: 6,7-dimethyl-8-ribityllumazine synthase [Bacteroidales bacterium]|nr:6,7-dimethyl-8-ribityllumazine synthase [Bacteroidales bacterium]HOY39866.1 6,7-dimethyl-8-ribityllumazine synthase [Bacteroidales bacterium]HQP05101.1 6,7-dimethyl-8-ribityllumazine synthase [Bacteroidales bacterium]